MLYKRVNSVF